MKWSSKDIGDVVKKGAKYAVGGALVGAAAAVAIPGSIGIAIGGTAIGLGALGITAIGTAVGGATGMIQEVKDKAQRKSRNKSPKTEL